MKFRKVKKHYITHEDKRYILKGEFPGNIKASVVIIGYIYLYGSTILIKKGYKWDGASGPTWDDMTNYDSSLVHDALCQLMREGKLSMSYWKAAAEELRVISLDHGMNKYRAWAWYWAVRAFGGKQAKPSKYPQGQIIDTDE